MAMCFSYHPYRHENRYFVLKMSLACIVALPKGHCTFTENIQDEKLRVCQEHHKQPLQNIVLKFEIRCEKE